MKNKVFSGALFLENLKRFAGLMIAGFLIMFLSGPFELLMSGNRYRFWFVENMLNDENVGFVFVQLALPVCAAVAVFQYLYKVNSTSMIHAMPFSKTKLYVTNYISGLVISMVPQILNWLLLIVLQKPTGNAYTEEGDVAADFENIYTFATCSRWLAFAFLIVIFTYSIAVLACMVSGNGVIATLTGFAFNGLVALLMFIAYGFIVTNCYGVDDNQGMWDAILRTHPVCQIIGQSLTIADFFIYLLIAVAIAIAVRYIYYLRKLERCGDSYVFDIIKDFIGFVFVLAASSATGLLLFEGMGFSAYLIGGIIGFVIGQMITRKTFRLWNKKTLKNFIIFFVLMVLIVCGFMFDFFGIEDRIPAIEKIEAIEYSDSFMSYDGYEDVTSDNPEVINAITALHRDILDHKEEFQNSDRIYDMGWSSFDIKYQLKNGSIVERDYDLPYEYLANSPYVQILMENNGEKIKLENLRSLDPENMDFSIRTNMFNGDGNTITEHIKLTKEQTSALKYALAQDMLNSMVEDRLLGKPALFNIELQYSYKPSQFNDEKAAKEYFSNIVGYSDLSEYDFGERGVAFFNFNVYSGYNNTLKVLEDIAGESIIDMLLPEGCIGVLSPVSDYLWTGDFYDKYTNNDGYFVNIPAEGDVFQKVDDRESIYNILTNASGRYSSNYIWLSVLYNAGESSISPYQEVYTAWVSVKDLPSSMQAKAEKMLEYAKNSKYAEDIEIR